MGKLDYTRRSANLYARAVVKASQEQSELRAAIERGYAIAKVCAKLSTAQPAIVSNAKPRGRPIVSTGDPKRDARNKQQRELMAKRRAKA